MVGSTTNYLFSPDKITVCKALYHFQHFIVIYRVIEITIRELMGSVGDQEAVSLHKDPQYIANDGFGFVNLHLSMLFGHGVLKDGGYQEILFKGPIVLITEGCKFKVGIHVNKSQKRGGESNAFCNESFDLGNHKKEVTQLRHFL